MKRSFDFIFSAFAFVILMFPALIVAIMILVTSKGYPLYWSKRVGLDNKLFNMPKFRSMRPHTPALATHIMSQQSNPNQYLIPIGGFIRKTSLDEIPQIWSVLKGDMSIVGPRPALFNQDDLVKMRTDSGVHKLKPGITGWAQVNGRDEIPITQKVALDVYYLKHQSLRFDIYIVLLTILKVIKRDNVSH
jgi:O-antigen biosynthesis protein WbqP